MNSSLLPHDYSYPLKCCFFSMFPPQSIGNSILFIIWVILSIKLWQQSQKKMRLNPHSLLPLYHNNLFCLWIKLESDTSQFYFHCFIFLHVLSHLVPLYFVLYTAFHALTLKFRQIQLLHLFHHRIKANVLTVMYKNKYLTLHLVVFGTSVW